MFNGSTSNGMMKDRPLSPRIMTPKADISLLLQPLLLFFEYEKPQRPGQHPKLFVSYLLLFIFI